jgi:hypothetical protein
MGHSNNPKDHSKSPNENSKCPNELKGKQEHQKQTYIIYEYIHTTKYKIYINLK